MTAAGVGPVVVACDKFKGTLTATEVGLSVAQGIHDASPQTQVVAVPVADGGDGTIEAITAAGFALAPVIASGPTGLPVATAYATRGAVAVVELADACGFVRLPAGRLEPMTASSHGVGEVLRAALDAGRREIVLAIGGSASSDGGAGMLEALGAVLRTRDGKPLPRGGGALDDLGGLDLSGLHPALAEAQIILASDVRNPLLGVDGAVAVYGPQKGATGEAAVRLERGLERWARVLADATGHDHADSPGAGAAGGVGVAAMAALGARMESGVDLVLDLVGLDRHLDGASLVVTGEGSIDSQTLHGKTPVGVARAARRREVPVVGVCGRRAIPEDAARGAGIDRIFALQDIEPDRERSMANAGPLLRRLARHLAAELLP
ncbi:glycerate kinase [Cellulomonas timonensis]|uniref:glycerate kinase n=1 Tax=Cellulomonas timonensis TaxID=1689271 RepID=UPI000AF9D7B7|nr:glycerate kinase [Cellulomonas timonensis]